MEWMKEKASDAAASARSATEKTKASVGEKVDNVKAQDELDKDLATQRKEERQAEAELRKQEAHEHNAAQRQANTTARTTGPTF